MAGDEFAVVRALHQRWRAAWRAVREQRKVRNEVREWATFVVTALGLVGIVFAYLSLKQNLDSTTRTDQRTRYQTISERLLGPDAALVQHPDLIPYFRDGRKLDNHVDARTRQTVVALAIERVDYDEYAFNQLLNIGLGYSTFIASDSLRPENTRRPAESK